MATLISPTPTGVFKSNGRIKMTKRCQQYKQQLYQETTLHTLRKDQVDESWRECSRLTATRVRSRRIRSCSHFHEMKFSHVLNLSSFDRALMVLMIVHESWRKLNPSTFVDSRLIRPLPWLQFNCKVPSYIPTVRQNWSIFSAPSLFINCMKGNSADCVWRMSAMDRRRA